MKMVSYLPVSPALSRGPDEQRAALWGSRPPFSRLLKQTLPGSGLKPGDTAHYGDAP